MYWGSCNQIARVRLEGKISLWLPELCPLSFPSAPKPRILVCMPANAPPLPFPLRPPLPPPSPESSYARRPMRRPTSCSSGCCEMVSGTWEAAGMGRVWGMSRRRAAGFGGVGRGGDWCESREGGRRRCGRLGGSVPRQSHIHSLPFSKPSALTPPLTRAMCVGMTLQWCVLEAMPRPSATPSAASGLIAW